MDGRKSSLTLLNRKWSLTLLIWTLLIAHVRLLRIPHPPDRAAVGCAAAGPHGLLLAFRAPVAWPVCGDVRHGALRCADRHHDPGVHRQARHADAGAGPLDGVSRGAAGAHRHGVAGAHRPAALAPG